MIQIQTYNSKYNYILTQLNLFNHSNYQTNSILSYANKNPNLVPVAVEKNNQDQSSKAIGIALGYIENQNAWILGLFISTFHDHPVIFIRRELISYFENQYPNKKWSIRLTAKFDFLIPIFQNIGFFIVDRLNLYHNDTNYFKKKQIEFRYSDGEIRIAKSSDIPRLQELEAKCFDKFWRNNEPTWNALIREKDSCLVNVFELSSEIIGYNYNTVKRIKKTQEGQYIRIGTHPAYRGQYIARLLTEKAFNWFRDKKVSIIYLSTIKSNQKLNNMYVRWGFTKYGEETILTKGLLLN